MKKKTTWAIYKDFVVEADFWDGPFDSYLEAMNCWREKYANPPGMGQDFIVVKVEETPIPQSKSYLFDLPEDCPAFRFKNLEWDDVVVGEGLYDNIAFPRCLQVRFDDDSVSPCFRYELTPLTKAAKAMMDALL